MTQELEREEMSAERRVGVEIAQSVGELPGGEPCRQAAERGQLGHALGVVGGLEERRVKLGRAGDELDVAAAVGVAENLRSVVEGVDLKHLVARAAGFPGFLERGGGLEMAGAGGDGQDRDAHDRRIMFYLIAHRS